MANLANLTVNDTGFLKLPSGTGAQRPVPSTGMVRYNSSRQEIEIYSGSQWISGSNPTTTIVTNNLLANVDPGNPASYSGTGTTITDLSGNGRNGTLQNSPTFSTANNGVIIVNGTNQYISFSSWGAFPNFGTISFWMYSTSVTNYRNIFHTNYTGTGNNIGIRFEQVTGAPLYVIIGNDFGTNTVATYGSTPLIPNTWYNVAITWNTTTQSAVLYLNGVTVSLVQNSYWPTQLASPSYGVGFGNGSDRWFQGSVSQLLYYNAELTAQQIKQNFFANATRFNLGIT